ncbi:hypothetical protein GCM10009564_05610 [Streptomyces thermogriseus]|uniref:Transposase n=1 Tax=Streptomyces thermogriseus TaxID=75292 RepID=A0ABP4DBQ1_9ACTN
MILFGDDSVRRSSVRESSSRPHTPKGTAARIFCGPEPSCGTRPVPRTFELLASGAPDAAVLRSMHERHPVTQRLLPYTAGLREARAGGRTARQRRSYGAVEVAVRCGMRRPYGTECRPGAGFAGRDRSREGHRVTDRSNGEVTDGSNRR